ncbi:hypothetical protein [Amycolatopsis sp. RTGN1]|uniref:hypothetical protein n=1 Tax=Amycolatopsis ponsaeliensis TaxID=2992142 RepID=UPI002551405F|nr:hypothetical protein [Amycolatopsis sp. RTGN1]
MTGIVDRLDEVPAEQRPGTGYGRVMETGTSAGPRFAAAAVLRRLREHSGSC